MTRREAVLAAVALYANNARTDVVLARFEAAGIDVLHDAEHLRAVAQLALQYRLREEPSEDALALLGVAA